MLSGWAASIAESTFRAAASTCPVCSLRTLAGIII
jgi:hypothetical protein